MGTVKKRKTSKGRIQFDAEVRHRGELPLYRTFSRLTDARTWIRDTEARLSNCHEPTQVEAERHTLSEAVDRFLAEVAPRKPRAFADQKREVLWFKDRAGKKRLSEVSPALLTELKTKFLAGTTRFKRKRLPQTWNRYLSSISCVFEMCMREWFWMEENPARRVKREKEAPGRRRFLSEEERARLLDACQKSPSPSLYPLVVLALSTGMRRGEIRRLTWPQVDFVKGVIILTHTKNGEPRRVPVRGLALTLLKEHAKVRRIDSDLVFPGENSTKPGRPFALDNAWFKALEEAQIHDFRFHDCRHSCASWLAMNGASLLEIAEVLGHKTLQMVKRYSHLAESHTAGVVERMNRNIFGV